MSETEKTSVNWKLDKPVVEHLKQLKSKSKFSRMDEFANFILANYCKSVGDGTPIIEEVSQAEFIALQLKVDVLERDMMTLKNGGQLFPQPVASQGIISDMEGQPPILPPVEPYVPPAPPASTTAPMPAPAPMPPPVAAPPAPAELPPPITPQTSEAPQLPVQGEGVTYNLSALIAMDFPSMKVLGAQHGVGDGVSKELIIRDLSGAPGVTIVDDINPTAAPVAPEPPVLAPAAPPVAPAAPAAPAPPAAPAAPVSLSADRFTPPVTVPDKSANKRACGNQWCRSLYHTKKNCPYGKPDDWKKGQPTVGDIEQHLQTLGTDTPSSQIPETQTNTPPGNPQPVADTSLAW